VANIFFDAVHNGAVAYYDEIQREAWGGMAPDPVAWTSTISRLSGFVAEKEGVAIGFMTFDATGFIHHAFVKADESGNGVGWRLYGAVEESIGAAGGGHVTTNASKKAKPFFERQGWAVEAEQVAVRRGIQLTNYRMFKALANRLD